jgi:hypothetical protein
MNYPSIKVSLQLRESKLLSQGFSEIARECYLAPDGKVKDDAGIVVGVWKRIEADE